jgi:hypothetical protein
MRRLARAKLAAAGVQAPNAFVSMLEDNAARQRRVLATDVHGLASIHKNGPRVTGLMPDQTVLGGVRLLTTAQSKTEETTVRLPLERKVASAASPLEWQGAEQ